MTRYEDPKAALSRIFTADAYDKICLMAGQPQCHRTIASAACKYVNEKTGNHDMDDPSASADDLLHNFGIQQRRDFLGSKLIRWFSRRLPSSTRTHPQVDCKSIETLAAVFCEQNPDGGSGYSFGALLERYLAFHLIYYHNQLANINEYMIGGRIVATLQALTDVIFKKIVLSMTEMANRLPLSLCIGCEGQPLLGLVLSP